MEIPSKTPNSIARIIDRCWMANANARPTFQQLEEALSQIIDDSVRRSFEHLDEPYQRRNLTQLMTSKPLDIKDVKEMSNDPSTSGYVNLATVNIKQSRDSILDSC